MAVLVVADHDNASLKDNTHKTVTAALALSSDVDVLVAGQGVAGVAAEAAKIAGVRKVLTAESDQLGKGIAEAEAALVLSLMGGYDAVLVPATSAGKNFAPRVAAKLDVAPISEIVEVIDASTFVRPIYAGNAMETVRSSDAKKIITVRANRLQGGRRGRFGGDREGRPRSRRAEDPVRVGRDRQVHPSCSNWARPRSSSPADGPVGSAEEFQRVIEPLAGQAGRRRRRSRAAVIGRLRPERLSLWSARPARWSRRSSTSPSASPAPSSTWQG